MPETIVGGPHGARPAIRRPSAPRRPKEAIVNICIPVTADRGLESPVSGHFGSAPIYMLVDVETRQARALTNARAVHEHGACRPLDALAGEKIDALVVGGIGAGALMKLQGAGIRVFRATAPTVAGCLDAFARNEVEEIGPGGACGRHGHGHDEEHDHGRHGAGHATGLPTRS
jgi:predicted Fe-Mo cluster-binding NifX family protein